MRILLQSHEVVPDVTIDAGSIETRVEMRDNDLRSAHSSRSRSIPPSRKSKRVAANGAGNSKVTGDLTIHGVTKEVALDVDGSTAPINDPRGNPHMGASARDFSVGSTTGLIGDEVTIDIDVEPVQQSEPPLPPPKKQEIS